MAGASLGFVGLLVVPALDFRFKWSAVPAVGVAIGDVLFVLGFGSRVTLLPRSASYLP